MYKISEIRYPILKKLTLILSSLLKFNSIFFQIKAVFSPKKSLKQAVNSLNTVIFWFKRRGLFKWRNSVEMGQRFVIHFLQNTKKCECCIFYKYISYLKKYLKVKEFHFCWITIFIILFCIKISVVAFVHEGSATELQSRYFQR